MVCEVHIVVKYDDQAINWHFDWLKTEIKSDDSFKSLDGKYNHPTYAITN